MVGHSFHIDKVKRALFETAGDVDATLWVVSTIAKFGEVNYSVYDPLKIQFRR